MGEINVPGLGSVTIEGETPTPAEMGRIQEILRAKTGEKVPSEATTGDYEPERPSPTAKPATAPETATYPQAALETDLRRSDLIYDEGGAIIGFVDYDNRKVYDPNYVNPKAYGHEPLKPGQPKSLAQSGYEKRLLARINAPEGRINNTNGYERQRAIRIGTGDTFGAEALEARREEHRGMMETMFDIGTMGASLGVGLKVARWAGKGVEALTSSRLAGTLAAIWAPTLPSAGIMGTADATKAVVKGSTLEEVGGAFVRGATNELLGQTVIGGAFTVGTVAYRGSMAALGALARVSSPAASAITNRMAAVGVEAAATDIASPTTSLGQKVLGVFPFIGAPLRAREEFVRLKADEQIHRILDGISPRVTDIPQLSEMIGKQAADTMAKRLDGASRLIERGTKTLDDLGTPAVHSMIPVRDTIKDYYKGAQSHLQALDPGLRPPGADKMITGIKEIDDALKTLLVGDKSKTHLALRADQQHVIGLIDKHIASQTYVPTGITLSSLIEDIRATFKVSLGTFDQKVVGELLKTQGPASAAMLADAVQQIRNGTNLTASTLLLYRGLATRPLTSVDHNIFRAGFVKPGSKEMDEVVQAFANGPHLGQSPRFVESVREIVGDSNVQKLARIYVERALALTPGQTMQHSLTPGVAQSSVGNMKEAMTPGATQLIQFDARKAIMNLGLAGEGATKAQPQALDAMLSGTGVTAKMLKESLEGIEQLGLFKAADPGTFLTRRITLGGVGALGIAGVAGAEHFAPGSSIVMGSMILSARHVAKLLTTPKGLALLRDGPDVNASGQAWSAFAYRLHRLLDERWFSQDGEPLVDGAGRTTMQAILNGMEPAGPDKTIDQRFKDAKERRFQQEPGYTKVPMPR